MPRYLLKNITNDIIFILNTCKMRENIYFCIVFFIVLDLRLTRLGYGGIPFFMPKG